MISYEEFTQVDHTSIIQQDYFRFIVIFAKDIITDVENSNQGTVAKKLGLHLSHFNAMLRILKALDTSSSKLDLEQYKLHKGELYKVKA
jgi:hypothetical protein